MCKSILNKLVCKFDRKENRVCYYVNMYWLWLLIYIYIYIYIYVITKAFQFVLFSVFTQQNADLNTLFSHFP